MTELTRTINNINELSMAQSDITSLQESVNNSTTNISTLESYTVSNGTNFGVGPDVLNQLTTGIQNTAVGNLAAGGLYRVSTGSGNVMVGYNSGGSCESGLNNTFLGTNTQFQPGVSSISGFIGLVASNVTSFNISGLTASTGTGEGTILDFDSSGNIIPSAGTYNTVSKIDMIISTIQGQLPTEIIFTTTSTDPPDVTWTVPAGVNSVTIEASGSGAPGTPAIATSTSGVYQGGSGGGSGQVGNITIPVAEGMELTISLGAVSPPGNTIAYGTAVEINGV